MINRIRAHKLFSLVPELAASERLVTMKIPIRRLPQYEDYSLRLLEMMSVIALIRIVNAKQMFEFGTFLGNTTLHMALNSPADARIVTLDADDETLERIGLLETYKWRKQFPLEFEGTSVEHKIQRLRGNSHTVDLQAYKADLVLIDGDHSATGVMIDTRNAKNMLTANGCIIWHDYQNPLCEGNTEYLNYLSEEQTVFYVDDTMLAFTFQNLELAQRLLHA